MAANKTTEQELVRAVLEILNDSPDGTSPVAGIRKALPDYFNLAADDHDESVTRSGEEMWEQQVRNLKSHSSSKHNPFPMA